MSHVAVRKAYKQHCEPVQVKAEAGATEAALARMMGPRKPKEIFRAGAAAEVLCAAAASAASLTDQGEAPPPAAAPAQEREAHAAGASPAKRAEREAGTLTKQRDATPNLLGILPTQSDSPVVLPLPLAWLRTPSQP